MADLRQIISLPSGYDLFFHRLFSLPLSPSTQRGEASGDDKFAILREEDTSVSPPLQDQGGRFTVAIPC